MDAEDRQRATGKRAVLLRELQRRGVLTNHEVRQIAGSRGMGRVHELIHDFGEPIEVRKVAGATWEVRYCPPDPGTYRDQRLW